MIRSRPKDKHRIRVQNRLFFGIFLLLYAGYFWLRIDPEISFFLQQPAFYFTPQFIRPFLLYPGGLLEALSALLMQCGLIPPLGALVLSAVFVAIALLTRVWIRAAGGGSSPLVFAFPPVVFLFIRHHAYEYPMTQTLGLLAALAAFAFFHGIQRRSILGSWTVFLLLFPLLFYCCGGPALCFALLCVLTVFTDGSRKPNRRVWTALVIAAVAGATTLLFAPRFMIATLGDSVRIHLAPFSVAHGGWVSWALIGYYPLVFVVIRLMRIQAIRKPLRKMRTVSRSAGFQFALLLILHGAAALYAFDGQIKDNLSIQLDAHERRWDGVLKRTRGQERLQVYSAVQRNRALYHTGRLLDSMFVCDQSWGTQGLFYPQEYGYVYPLQISDLFYDLAHITESQHWAYEAQAVHPDSPWNLQRLIQTHILKGNLPAARRHLLMLTRSLFFTGWTRRYQAYLEHPPKIMQDEALRETFNRMPNDDFFVHSAAPGDDLKALLRSNPDNRMAFEYLMALGLLSKNLALIVEYTPFLIRFGYAHIPTHLEEAFLIYLTSDPEHRLVLPGYRIRQRTADRFTSYLQIRQAHRKDPGRMRQALSEAHAASYWFYYDFIRRRDIDALPVPQIGAP